MVDLIAIIDLGEELTGTCFDGSLFAMMTIRRFQI